MNIRLKGFFFILGSLLINYTADAQANSGAANNSKTGQWFQQKKWLNGLQLQPHLSVNAVEFEKQYKANKRLWDTAFAFLKTHDLPDLAAGKYPLLEDSVYVTVTEGALKDSGQTQWESHRKYIDLQYVAKGKEKIGVAPVSAATVTEAYNTEKDIAHYQAAGQYYVAEPGRFFLFFPQDAHRPGIRVNANGSGVTDMNFDKKIVVKIMAAQ